MVKYSYDRRSGAARWDQTVLSVTPEELQSMDSEERAELLADSLHRAADLAIAIAAAFAGDLGVDAKAVAQNGKALHTIARKVR